jgi:hypothetical protein
VCFANGGPLYEISRAPSRASAPFPKFASLRRNPFCELRKHQEHWQLYDSSAVYEFEIPAMDSRQTWQEFSNSPH